MGIRSAITTFDPALDILIERGFTIYCEDLDIDGKHDDYNKDWTAIKDDFLVTAINPIELLGLAMIYEKYGEGWLKKKYKSNYKDYFKNLKL